MLSAEEVELIDNWRFENRLPSRAAAIRELMGRSIHTNIIDPQESTPSSREIGVAESAVTRLGPPSFCVADAKQKDLPIVFVSEGFVQLCEYESDEVIGKNCRFLQGDDTDPQQVRSIREAIEANKPVEVELTNYRKSGSAYQVIVKIEPVFINDQSRPDFFVGTQSLVL